MNDVLIAQSKGGVGKSTLVCLLTMALDSSSVPVAVLDLDLQGTTRRWLTDHLATLPNVELLDNAHSQTIKPAAVRLIDTEGRSNFEHSIAELPHADLYLVPATPSIEDVTIAAKTIELLLKHRPKANLRLLWNRIREGHDDCDPNLLKEYANQMGIVAMKNYVHESKPYRDARYPPPQGGWARACKSRHSIELRKLAHEVLAALL